MWNDLPDDVTSAKSLSSFCQQIKSYLFTKCFLWSFHQTNSIQSVSCEPSSSFYYLNTCKKIPHWLTLKWQFISTVTNRPLASTSIFSLVKLHHLVHESVFVGEVLVLVCTEKRINHRHVIAFHCLDQRCTTVRHWLVQFCTFLHTTNYNVLIN